MVCRKFILVLIITVAFVGCSVQNMGNSILETVGILPKTSVFSGANSIVNATKEFSKEEEYYLGRAVSAKILSDHPLYNNEALSRYVNRVGSVVVAYSDAPGTFGGFHFGVLDTVEINALSTPGGFIYITKGLLDVVPDEDALAAVLAHEVAHVTLRHGVKSISQSNLTKSLLSLGQIAGSLNCGQVLQEATLVFGGAVQDVVSTLVERGYSRDQEKEADLEAVKILQRSGYDTQSMLAMLDIVGELNKEESKGGWFKTHPGIEERKREVNSLMAYYGNAEVSVIGRNARTERYAQVLSRK